MRAHRGITRDQQVQIPSESLIQFRLTNPVGIRVQTTDAGGSPQHLPGN